MLDDAVMPAVDHRAPDGLRFDEVAQILRGAIATGTAIGLEFTIFNRAVDVNDSPAHALVDMLASGLCP